MRPQCPHAGQAPCCGRDAVSSGVIIFFEITLVLGLALVFGVREIFNLRRYDRMRAAKNKAEEEARATNPPDAAS